MREVEHGLSLGLQTRIIAMIPPARIFGVIGTHRTYRILHPEFPTVNVDAAHDLVRSFIELSLCPGPVPTAEPHRHRRVPLPIVDPGQSSLVEPSFGGCAIELDGSVRPTSSVERCGTVAGLVDLITEALREAADEKGLIESLGKLVSSKINKYTIETVCDAARDFADVQEHASEEVRRLAERASFFLDVSRVLLKAVKYLNVAKNGLDLVRYLTVLRSYDALCEHLPVCDEFPPDPEPQYALLAR
jgi:hypothetical protein